MNGELKYGGVALGVEAALPVLRPRERMAGGYARSVLTSVRRTLIWLFVALKRWA